MTAALTTRPGFGRALAAVRARLPQDEITHRVGIQHRDPTDR